MPAVMSPNGTGASAAPGKAARDRSHGSHSPLPVNGEMCNTARSCRKIRMCRQINARPAASRLTAREIPARRSSAMTAGARIPSRPLPASLCRSPCSAPTVAPGFTRRCHGRSSAHRNAGAGITSPAAALSATVRFAARPTCRRWDGRRHAAATVPPRCGRHWCLVRLARCSMRIASIAAPCSSGSPGARAGSVPPAAATPGWSRTTSRPADARGHQAHGNASAARRSTASASSATRASRRPPSRTARNAAVPSMPAGAIASAMYPASRTPSPR